MSRIGKKPILVPTEVDIKIVGQKITVHGPKGNLSIELIKPITVTYADNKTLSINRSDDEWYSRSLHGLYRTLLANLITGVTCGYMRKMEIFGVGYRVQLKEGNLEFSLGYSHPILITAPKGIKFNVDTPTKFSVSGIDKQKVGQISSIIRRLRRPDPYKGKGIHYDGEIIRRKVGKTGK